MTRPGGRSARVREAVLAATYAELVEHGYLGLTVENVATRAGVHKTTVYRRWATIDVLIADALDQARGTDWPVPDTGTLEGDLIAIADEVVQAFTDPAQRAVPEAIVTAALHSERAREAKRDFYTARHTQAAEVVTRAIARGEVPEDTDPVELVRLTCAPLYYRIFITGEPLDHDTARRSARAALAAARAGAV
ncbi:TetR/AcrR family transcriptional regulator [Saccharothrix variisporea]|uniref:TetR family transcriptional regulator n=1 Tax=Saccharothrix variisporea TaxID=543527 RepID=A0A495XJS3_9PSEU|nr:TetR/AcrR family transcriptional regulator [Saccharothrix variisporea]RKT73074.1 TetR family transcriptional regulator [Saccharothrix variisporea]